MGLALEADTPPPTRRNRRTSKADILPGGRRALTLTLEQVADALQVDVRTVRKLMKHQREEDAAAEAQGRAARLVGLRGLYISDRVTRVTEQALGDYLKGCSNNTAR